MTTSGNGAQDTLMGIVRANQVGVGLTERVVTLTHRPLSEGRVRFARF